MPTDRNATAKPERRLAAILAADAAGYSRLMAADDVATVDALQSARAVFRRRIETNQGRVVDMAGDSVLALFETAGGATLAALTIQEELENASRTVDEARRLSFRIGVHLGDIIEKPDGTAYGDGVNVAARLEGIAEVGGVCISSVVFDTIGRELRTRFESIGEQRAKNIERLILAYRTITPTRQPIVNSTANTKSTPDQAAIAVLPFDNMSGDSEQDYFSDGIAEDIITGISRIPALLVIARNSTFAYKGKATKIQEVCRDLGVRYVLEGSVRKSGNRVRVTAQLIDGKSGGHIWAERFDRELADIFAVQDELTGKIVRALEIKLVGANRAHGPGAETSSPQAYDCVLRGREKYRLFSKDGNAAAQQNFKAAIELDPNYAQAYAGLAETYLHDWFHGSADGLDRAYALAQTANSLDPGLPLVYEALASIYLFRRQFDEALAASHRWLEIEPGSAEAHANLAAMLHFAGEPERVGDLIETAMRLNPFYPYYYNLSIGQACFTMRRFQDAVHYINRSIAQNSESLYPRLWLAACYGQLGRDGDAHQAVAEVRRLSPGYSLEQARSMAAYKRPVDLELLLEGLQKAGLVK